jgi:hypothetical protein
MPVGCGEVQNPPAPSGIPITKIGLDETSSLCTTGFHPNLLTGFFVRSLRDHFSDPDNLEFGGRNEFRIVDGQREVVEELQNYVWSEGPNTKILIDPVWKYNRENIQARPGLLVRRDPFSRQSLVLGDGYTVRPKRDADGNVERVQGRYQTCAIVGSHTIFCIGGSGAEAELLGAEVFNHFSYFGQLFREELHMHEFAAKSVEAVAYLEEFDDHYVVPVVVSYGYMAAWRVEREAPWLKSIAIDVQSE